MPRKRRKFSEAQISAIENDRRGGLGWKATLEKHKISGSTLLRIDRRLGSSKIHAAKVALKHTNHERRKQILLSVDLDTFHALETLSPYINEPKPIFAGRLLKEQLQEVLRRAAKENR